MLRSLKPLELDPDDEDELFNELVHMVRRAYSPWYSLAGKHRTVDLFQWFWKL